MRTFPSLTSPTPADYTDYLGLNVEEFNLGWVALYRSPRANASI